MPTTNFESTLEIEFANSANVPVKSVTVSNPRGYKNVKITKDTFTRNGTRFKLTTGEGTSEESSIFVHLDSLSKFIEALDIAQTSMVDLSTQR